MSDSGVDGAIGVGLAAAFERCAVGLALLDADSRPLRVNDALCHLLARPRDELLSGGPLLLGTPEQAQEETRQRRAMRQGGASSYGGECEHRRADGRVAWLRQTCSRVPAGTGGTVLLLLQVEDLTAARELEAALHASEERARRTFEGAPLGIAHVDLQGNILRVNRRLAAMHGYTAAELAGRSTFDLMTDHGEAAGADMAGLLRGQWHQYTAERNFVRKSGDVYPARVSVSLVRPPAGQPYFISMVEDISKQKAAERRLQRQAQMLDNVTDAVVVHRNDRRIHYWNRGAEKLFGWRAEQALGRTFAELLGPGAAVSDEALAQLMRDGHLLARVSCRTPDGRALLVERRFAVIEGIGREEQAVLSVNRAVTPPAP
jgi:PAS domain S-box-containing protein